jgi:hypothetical protein
MKKNIVWLASYPKSGNTWTRVFMANYVANPSKPLPINDVYKFGMGDSIADSYHRVAGHRINTQDTVTVSKLRDKVLLAIASNNADVNFVKTHNGNYFAHNKPLIPHQVTKSAVYVIRNPLDMVLSYARHYDKSPEEATDLICHKKNQILGDPTGVGSFLGTWNDHVVSWTNFLPFPVLILKYEDMLADPHKEFRKLLLHLGVTFDEERLDRAVQFSSFKELHSQEKESGFIERSSSSKSQFFSEGRSGQWKEKLAPELVSKIRKVNIKSMKRFGYYNV